MAHMGHPLVGDKLYGPNEEFFIQAIEGVLSPKAKEALRLERHALHNHKLVLTHPETDETLELECPLPVDMRLLFESDQQ
jgi:23S rRNA pseudouridine1911/1915/1917 synthase